MTDEENIPRPTCGRIVHYVCGTGDIWAAIVMKDPAAPRGLRVDLTVFGLTGPRIEEDVPYDKDNHPGSWHWMAYQLGQASLGKKPGT